MEARKSIKVNPPFTNLGSFLLNAEILSYWDYADEIWDLLMELNHNSRLYCKDKTHQVCLKNMVKFQPPVYFEHNYMDFVERVEVPVELSDATIIGGTNWENLKSDAMDKKYMHKSWYSKLDADEIKLLESLRDTQKAQKNMYPLFPTAL